MDSFLLEDNEFYLAENCVRSFTTPALIPAIVFSAITGILAVAFYEKFIRKDYFLPYFYFGNTALLYAVSHIFLIIFVSEDNAIQELLLLEEKDVDLTHEFGLYASLILAAFGSFFINLGAFRLLEIWVRRGQHKNTHLASYYLTVLTIVLSTVPAVFSISGDIVLVHESAQEREMSQHVRIALILKLMGALCNIVLVLLYIALCICYAWSAYISNVCEKAIGRRISSQSPSSSTFIGSLKPTASTAALVVDQTFNRVVTLLLIVGLLILLRFVYDVYIVIAIINLGPIWDAHTYLVLVVADSIILLMVAYSSSLTLVSTPVVYAKMRQRSFRNYYWSPATSTRRKKQVATSGRSNGLLSKQQQQEIIPLSRSPVILEEEEYPNRM